MDAFKKLNGLVVPIDRANVDTDAIIPKQFLKSIKRSGFGPNAFDEWRYLDHGEPGMDNSKRKINPYFVLNQARYQGASILLSRKNFGCGSSREHAPWAFKDFGLDVIIAPSFGEIFYHNCLKNALLAIAVDPESHHFLSLWTGLVTVDLEQQMIQAGGIQVSFAIDPFMRFCLMRGLSQLGYVTEQEPLIALFEQKNAQRIVPLSGVGST